MPDASPDALLAMLDSVDSTGETGYEKAQLQAQLYSQQGNLAAAANSVLKTNMPDAQKVEQVWQWITAIPKESLAQVGETYPALSPFITLRKLTEENAAPPAIVGGY